MKALTFSVSLCVGSSNTTIVTPALRVYEQLEYYSWSNNTSVFS